MKMTPEAFWEKFHIPLNGQQMEAAGTVDGRVLLLAVPGSGKTTVLVTRLGYMIYCCGIAPENILTVTYTVAATRDMAARFRSFFGEEYADRLEFRTINGICARVIYYYGTLIGKNAFELVTDEKRTAGMLASIYQRIQKGFATESELKNIRTLITYIKNSMLTDAELEELDRESEYHIAEIYREYCSQMRQQGLMDYDDQMTYALRILKGSRQTREYFQNLYRYICVDETQDTSKIQFAILDLLSEQSGNLFMVGDEDQSIYGFRAACPGELLRFEQKYPEGKLLLMEENFRSNSNIVSAADSFIQKNLLRHEKHMHTFRKAGAEIEKVTLRSRKEQYDFLMKTAKYGSGQTAVLYRDNESVLPLVDLLEREKVPYRMRSADLTFFSHRVVMDIRNILRFALEPDNEELFLQIYYKMNLFINKQDALRFCELARKGGNSILEAAMRGGYKELDFTERISRVERLSAVHRNLQNIAKEKPGRAIFQIENLMGYREYLERMGIGDGKLFVLKSLAEQEESIAGFLDRLEILQNRIREKENVPDCRFILSTIHASKGLEYDRVYLMDVADGIFPENVPDRNVRAMRTEEDRAEWAAYEEERRIFYVGMTRAKEELFLLDWKQNSTFGREIFGNNDREKMAVKGNCERTGKTSGGKSILKSNTQHSQEAFREFCDALGEGLIVTHKIYGEGVVTSVDDTYLNMEFLEVNGETTLRIFQLKMLFENNLITIPE